MSSCPTRSSWPWPSPWPASRARPRVEVGGDEALPLDQAERDVGQGQRPARGQPDAGATRGPVGDPQAGPVRHAGQGDHRGRGQGQGRGWRPDRGDHDPAGRDPRGARPDARGAGTGRRRDPGQEQGQELAGVVGDDDRAARGRRWSPARSPRWPSSSPLGPTTSPRPPLGSPATTSASSSGLYEERKLVPANPFVTIDQPGVGRLMQIACRGGPGRPVPASSWGSAASTAATPTRSGSATPSGWTTSPAPPSESPPPASPPAKPPSARPPPPPSELRAALITRRPELRAPLAHVASLGAGMGVD